MREITGTIAAALAGLTLSSGVAQATVMTDVAPDAYTTKAGGAASNSPFGNSSSTSFALQIGYAASQVDIPIGATISALGFRLATGNGNNSKALDYTNFEIDIGQSNNAIGSLDRNYANNMGADTVVARTGALNYAARSLTGNKAVNPFFTLSFTTPYIYEGGDLLITLKSELAAATAAQFVSLDAINISGNGSIVDTVGGSASNAASGSAHFFNAPVLQFSYTPAAVPEPGTWAILIAGVGMVGAMRRARRREAPGPIESLLLA